MKVLFYVNYPLAWAKGGHSAQILHTKLNLEKIGLEIEWLHHDKSSMKSADIIHYWTLPPNDFHWRLAKERGMKIIISTLHQTSVLRPHYSWYFRGWMRNIFKEFIGRGLYSTTGLDIYPHCDAALAVTPYEAEYMQKVLGTPPNKTHYIPNGVAEDFKNQALIPEPFDGLLYVGFISERKNSLEVAKKAKLAKIPLKFIGGPAFVENTYFHKFINEIDNEYIHWDGEVKDSSVLASKISGSKGLVLASKNEGCPLVVLEALALEKPVLLSRIPNMIKYFGNSVQYCSQPQTNRFIVELLNFYNNLEFETKERLQVFTWYEVATMINNIYLDVMK